MHAGDFFALRTLAKHRGMTVTRIFELMTHEYLNANLAELLAADDKAQHVAMSDTAGHVTKVSGVVTMPTTVVRARRAAERSSDDYDARA